jgi:hypothetical protein
MICNDVISDLHRWLCAFTWYIIFVMCLCLGRYGSIVFPNFSAGVAALRHLVSARITPASVRLVDNMQVHMYTFVLHHLYPIPNLKANISSSRHISFWLWYTSVSVWASIKASF